MTVSAPPGRPLALAGLLCLVLWPAVAVAQPAPTASAPPTVDPFYTSRLREGSAAFDRGDYAEAAASLRVACFGMLDSPPQLAECLVQLSLAQAGAGDREAFAQTFRRLLEGEEVLGLYSKSNLPAELRTPFESRAAEWIPRATLDDSPAFAHLAGAAREPDTAAKSGRSRRSRREAGAVPPAVTATATAPPATDSAAPPLATPTPPRASEGRPVAVESTPSGLTAADERELARLREQLAAATSMADVERTYAAMVSLAGRYPAEPRVQHAAAELAYRASRWRDAVRHFRQGGDPGESQPLLLFYLAVALWESGDAPAAAVAMQRCEGRLRPTPFVEAYRRKILGGDPTG